MKHPAILLTSLVTLTLLSSATAEERQWFAVNTYHLNSKEAAATFDATFAEVVVPDLKAKGLGPIGVFEPFNLPGKDGKPPKPTPLQRYVIVPLKAPSQLTHLALPAATDAAKTKGYLPGDKDDAIYSRVESSLLYAFEGMPTLAVPAKAVDNVRLFELRVYESHHEEKGKLKVEMFNKGEIELFNEVGLDAVFYGEAMAGKNLPNLTYMLVYNDEAHRKEAWRKFLTSPKWDTMKSNPRYAGTVSKIISQHMKPLPYSVIQ